MEDKQEGVFSKKKIACVGRGWKKGEGREEGGVGATTTIDVYYTYIAI